MRADLDRDRAVEARHLGARELAGQEDHARRASTCPTRRSRRRETVAERIRRALPTSAGAGHRGAGLRHEVPAARGRLRQAAGDGRRREAPAPNIRERNKVEENVYGAISLPWRAALRTAHEHDQPSVHRGRHPDRRRRRRNPRRSRLQPEPHARRAGRRHGRRLAGGPSAPIWTASARISRKPCQEIQPKQARIDELRTMSLRVTMTGDTGFTTNSAHIKPGFHSTMDKIADVVARYGKTSLTVAGHTDDVRSRNTTSRSPSGAPMRSRNISNRSGCSRCALPSSARARACRSRATPPRADGPRIGESRST